jgi:hypothetical protein
MLELGVFGQWPACQGVTPRDAALAFGLEKPA